MSWQKYSALSLQRKGECWSGKNPSPLLHTTLSFRVFDVLNTCQTSHLSGRFSESLWLWSLFEKVLFFFILPLLSIICGEISLVHLTKQSSFEK